MSISRIRRWSATRSPNRTSSDARPSRSTGGTAADTAQRPRDPRLVDEPARQRHRQRRQRQRPVAQHLDQLAPGAEHQHRSELPIDGAPQDQLVARAAIDHRLHGHAEKAALPTLRDGRRLDVIERARHRGLVRQPELDAADVGLVRDDVRPELHRDREARSRAPPRPPRPCRGPRASARPGCRSSRARPWPPPRRAASCPRRTRRR